MTRIWYDTEFLERGRNYPIVLISLGMLRESDGAQLYCVNSEMPMREIGRHQWLSENVVPHLPTLPASHVHGLFLDKEDPTVYPPHVIAEMVRNFVLGAPNPQLRAWYADYDHVVLCQLFGTMVNLPKGFPMWTYDLKQEATRLGNPTVPAQPPAEEHHALNDAIHAQRIDMFLTEMVEGTPG